MFIKKHVVIIGNGEPILNKLVANLLEQNCCVDIVLYAPPTSIIKDTLKRVNYFNVHEADVLANAEVVINTTFMVSPNNIKKIKKNLKFYRNIIKNINKNAKLIDITPLIKDNLVKSFYKEIKKCESYSREHFDNYISLATPVIFSPTDSLIQDIEELYNISNKIFNYKENFSYVDRDDLVDAILAIMENNNYAGTNFEIGNYSSTNIDYVNDSVIIDSKQLHEISSISWLGICLLSFIYKKKLNGFSRKYLYFIKAAKKTSKNALNLENLNIKKHSLLCMLAKYKDNNLKNQNNEDFEEYEIY
ncbi:MAG: hypothetical protein LBQ34_01495 [Alphaproteobacteria bacterium]|jgi:hypothetical protein|nr:hypothetical protein [Alphaproteobacteria bacterium]